MGAAPFPVTLIFARGATVWGIGTKDLHDKVASRHYNGMRLFDLAYPLGHLEGDVPSFIDSLAILTGEAKMTAGKP